MTYHLSEDTARVRRQRTEEAISLAMQSRWKEAVAVNRAILEMFPTDGEAYNRLGKALLELGRYGEAKEAYAAALRIDPNNTIAKKNLKRLGHVRIEEATPGEAKDRVDPHLFIEETGKTGFAVLHHLAPQETLAKLTAGDQVHLRVDGRRLVVESARGEYLGQVEPKLALRLTRFMEQGNRYAAALTSVGENSARIIIKETYHHPSLEGRLSFPPRGVEAFRPYIKESLLRHDLEEWDEEAESGAEWEEEPYAEEEPPDEEATSGEQEEEL